MEKGFNKGEYLKNEFNSFWQNILGEKQDFFSKISNESFDMLKAALSNINNIITYNATLKAVDRISEILNISDLGKVKIIDSVNSTKPSDNGYDIQFQNTKSFICEVKCNRPINGGNRFGSAQRDGITKDLKALLYGKSKSSINNEELKEFYKFLVIEEFDYKTTEAVKHFLSLLKGELKDQVNLYKDGMNINQDKVYVLLVR